MFVFLRHLTVCRTELLMDFVHFVISSIRMGLLFMRQMHKGRFFSLYLVDTFQLCKLTKKKEGWFSVSVIWLLVNYLICRNCFYSEHKCGFDTIIHIHLLSPKSGSPPLLTGLPMWYWENVTGHNLFSQTSWFIWIQGWTINSVTVEIKAECVFQGHCWETFLMEPKYFMEAFYQPWPSALFAPHSHLHLTASIALVP